VSKKTLFISLFSSIVILAIMAAIGWQMEMDKPIFAVTFDRVQWNDRDRLGIDGDGILLIRMAKDLIFQQVLIGKSKAEIIQLLGKPTVYSNDRDSKMRYSLRTIFSGIDPIRSDELIIQIDDRGRASQARIEFRDLRS
jgi:hypothetical protein